MCSRPAVIPIALLTFITSLLVSFHAISPEQTQSARTNSTTLLTLVAASQRYPALTAFTVSRNCVQCTRKLAKASSAPHPPEKPAEQKNGPPQTGFEIEEF
jgi:hypothetical protein